MNEHLPDVYILENMPMFKILRFASYFCYLYNKYLVVL